MADERYFGMSSEGCCDRWQPCARWFDDGREGTRMRDLDEGSVDSEVSPRRRRRRLSKRLDTMGWGLFFIWIGASLLLDLSWGVGLIGVAAIILLGQTARRSCGLRLEKFWIVVGGLFLLGGIWELYQVQAALLPVVLTIAGGALILSAIRRR